MKFFLISDNLDTLMGLRLAGIDGVVVHKESELERELSKAADNPEIGIVLISDKLMKLAPKLIYDIKLHRRTPLLLEIPDRHGEAHISDAITSYVRESIGVRI